MSLWFSVVHSAPLRRRLAEDTELLDFMASCAVSNPVLLALLSTERWPEEASNETIKFALDFASRWWDRIMAVVLERPNPWKRHVVEAVRNRGPGASGLLGVPFFLMQEMAKQLVQAIPLARVDGFAESFGRFSRIVSSVDEAIAPGPNQEQDDDPTFLWNRHDLASITPQRRHLRSVRAGPGGGAAQAVRALRGGEVLRHRLPACALGGAQEGLRPAQQGREVSDAALAVCKALEPERLSAIRSAIQASGVRLRKDTILTSSRNLARLSRECAQGCADPFLQGVVSIPSSFRFVLLRRVGVRGTRPLTVSRDLSRLRFHAPPRRHTAALSTPLASRPDGPRLRSRTAFPAPPAPHRPRRVEFSSRQPRAARADAAAGDPPAHHGKPTGPRTEALAFEHAFHVPGRAAPGHRGAHARGRRPATIPCRIRRPSGIARRRAGARKAAPRLRALSEPRRDGRGGFSTRSPAAVRAAPQTAVIARRGAKRWTCRAVARHAGRDRSASRLTSPTLWVVHVEA
ncbi:hypothetical protein DFJ74DRAFT_84246 [Hyaloraphidium curvatum]|nr:hypothetical protein DFJ74DRAFT_84246 [Hyaloraphidium curvatum]